MKPAANADGCEPERMRSRATPLRLRFVAIGSGGLTVLCAAVATWLAITTAARSLSIPPTVNSVVELPLTVRHEDSYEIAVRYRKTMPLETLSGLLSGNEFVEVHVFEDDHSVAIEHFQSLGYARAWLEQIIGSFSAKPGTRYRLRCRVLRPFDVLQSTNPTLVVSPNSLTVQAAGTTEGLITCAMILFGSLAIVCAVLYRRASKP